MHTTSTAVFDARVDTTDRIHPWIRALDAFGIPFLCYASDARRLYASPAASEFLRPRFGAATVGDQANRIVAEELNRHAPHLQIAQFALVREVPACTASLILAVHLARPATGEASAVVVLRPDSGALRVDDALLCGLTTRELEVAQLIAAGLATKEIAHRLGISTHTARHHTERVFTKLGVRSRAGAAAIIAGRMGSSSHGAAVGIHAL